jgi:hypothetical protein
VGIVVNTHSLKGASTLQVTIEGALKTFILNTGSGISLIQPGVSSIKLEATNVSPIGMTGDALRVQGEQEIEFRVNGSTFRHKFKVCSLPTEAHGILGTDYLANVNARLDLGNRILRLNASTRQGGGVSGGASIVRGEDQVAFTVFHGQSKHHRRPHQAVRDRKGRSFVERVRPQDRGLPSTHMHKARLSSDIKETDNAARLKQLQSTVV